MKRLQQIKIVAVLTAALGSAAQADVTVDIRQSGHDVVAVTGGTLDTTGLVIEAWGQTGGRIDASRAIFESAPPFPGGDIKLFGGMTGPSSWGAGSEHDATTAMGDQFTIAESDSYGLFGVPYDYIPGRPLWSTVTFGDSTFASLGLTPGYYLYTTPAGTITLSIGVLEPATWAMMLLGFGGIGLAVRRSRKQRPNSIQQLT